MLRQRRVRMLRAALGAGAWLLVGCGPAEEAPPQPAAFAPPVPVPEARGPRDVAVLSVASFGEIRIELLHDLAPRTVAHFSELAGSGFYDGTTFHRVIPGFVIQGGDPLSRDRDPRNDGQGGPSQRIEDEFSPVSLRRGVVALANRGRPGSAGSQFFVVLADARALDGRYTVFGRVTAGMDVVDRISQVERDQFGRRGPPDRPFENVVVEAIRIERGAGGRSRIAGEPRRGGGRLEFSRAGEPGGPGGGGSHPPAALADPDAP